LLSYILIETVIIIIIITIMMMMMMIIIIIRRDYGLNWRIAAPGRSWREIEFSPDGIASLLSCFLSPSLSLSLSLYLSIFLPSRSSFSFSPLRRS